MSRRLLIACLLCLMGCRSQTGAASAVPLASSAATLAAVKLVVIGDFGMSGPGEAAVATLAHELSPDFILTVGDNNYPHGKRDTMDVNIGDYYYDYIKFDRAYDGPHKGAGSQVQRFFPALGNHDWASGEGAAPHADYFDLPGNERYYRVTLGPVDVFVVDSDPHEPDGVDAQSKQALWLRQELAQSTARWKVVTMHHPPYSRGEHGDNTWMQWPYKAWGASLVLAGHDHDYERLSLDGFPYWVVGTGGAVLRTFNKPAFVQADTDVMYEGKYGLMTIDATAAELQLKFHTVDHELIDTYVLR